MGTDAEERRLALDAAQQCQHPLTILRIPPASRKTRKKSGWPLHREEPDQRQARVPHLRRELVGVVEEGGGEVLSLAGVVAVLAVPQVPLDDARERVVFEDGATQAVEERGEPRDRSREDEPARPQRAPGLAEGRQAVPALGQVVERAEEEDRARARVGEVEGPGVADSGAPAPPSTSAPPSIPRRPWHLQQNHT